MKERQKRRSFFVVFCLIFAVFSSWNEVSDKAVFYSVFLLVFLCGKVPKSTINKGKTTLFMV